ncbi:MAG: cytochrome c [Bacteroidota bacterium]
MRLSILLYTLYSLVLLVFIFCGLLLQMVLFSPEEQQAEEEEMAACCGSMTHTVPAEDSVEVQYDLGKALFKNNCATCHNRNMRDDMTGPALGGAEERWSPFPKADLYDWIRNSQAMIAEGHPRAVQLVEEWDHSVMSSFPNLGDAEIDAILVYVDYVEDGVPRVVE